MIEVKLINGNTMKFHPQDYSVYPENGCLRIKGYDSRGGKTRYLIPLNQVEIVTFD